MRPDLKIGMKCEKMQYPVGSGAADKAHSIDRAECQQQLPDKSAASAGFDASNSEESSFRGQLPSQPQAGYSAKRHTSCSGVSERAIAIPLI